MAPSSQDAITSFNTTSNKKCAEQNHFLFTIKWTRIFKTFFICKSENDNTLSDYSDMSGELGLTKAILRRQQQYIQLLAVLEDSQIHFNPNINSSKAIAPLICRLSVKYLSAYLPGDVDF